jgi:hypothetical protein
MIGGEGGYRINHNDPHTRMNTGQNVKSEENSFAKKLVFFVSL